MPLTIEYRPFALPPALPARVAAVTVAQSGDGATPARSRRLRPRTLAAIAALAVIGPLGWNGIAFGPTAAQASPSRAQPFETAGENFPGSAFYYLDSDSGVIPASRSLGSSPAENDRSALRDPGFGQAIARPTFLSGSSQDRFRALHCLTTAIYYEAASEPDAGQRAVAQVVLNRVAHPQWPNSVCGVVFQGSERPGCQFSFACDGSMARVPVRMWWDRALHVAERALAGEVYAPVGLATYYHTGAVNPRWAAAQTFIGAIGAHLFYRPPGGAGVAGAFTDRYWGGEPTPAPRPRLAQTPTLPSDPLAVAQSWAAARVHPDATPVPISVPQGPQGYAPAPGDPLPASGQIRAEYRDSGRWIASPKG
ncbi:MAG: cell wall hydrolase [Novosphingobium sp.]|nr:cell wall hydrolase [Novosphingobium sp.]